MQANTKIQVRYKEKWTAEATDRSPRVVLEREECILNIKGRSCPEEGMNFFNPVILRFRTLQNTENPIKTLHIRLEYSNSATSKAMAELLKSLVRAKSLGHDVKVIW
ncbi:DUF1987 domain-containing protein [Flavobacteriales bacterium]|nr:DUF1987 domain-containing protein [Flavobacteriales bacterium]